MSKHIKFLVEVLESQTKLSVEELEGGFKEFLKKIGINYRDISITIRSVEPKLPEKPV